MRIVFRADASAAIGHGHVMRCLTLADALHELDAEVSFVCREIGGHLCDLVERRGFRAVRLPAIASWEDDAAGTRAAIEASGANADWIVVDHYALDSRWQGRLRASTRRLMVIDDLADRAHECDLLLDQNLVGDMQTRYRSRVPVGARLLLGPEYALLRPAYARLHDDVQPRKGPVRRMLVSFGGADATDVTGRVVSAFLTLDRDDVVLDVVCSAGDAVAEQLRQKTGDRKNVRIHGGVESLAPLIASADLGVGAGGATSWERLCLGLPSIVVTLAENQRAIAAALHGAGLVRWLGDAADVGEHEISRALNEILCTELDEDWSRRCAAVVDGRGVFRVRGAIAAADALPFHVRPVRATDESVLLIWANDAETRANGFSAQPIPAAHHQAWFRQRLQRTATCRFYIVEADSGMPAGQVRFENEADAWEVHYAVAPPFRRLGLGRALLQAALRRFGCDSPGAAVYGKVKEGNGASRRIFEALGFTAQPAAAPGMIVYRLAANQDFSS